MSLCYPILYSNPPKKIDIKKANGIDKKPPKFEKLSANILSWSITKTINRSLSSGIFTDAAKMTALSPTDKDVGNKDSISKFRSVSILSVFFQNI